jgi:hypothetical protein
MTVMTDTTGFESNSKSTFLDTNSREVFLTMYFDSDVRESVMHERIIMCAIVCKTTTCRRFPVNRSFCLIVPDVSLDR